jgi:uncharacterized membrane protein YdfJ with MMPL/SSD domain
MRGLAQAAAEHPKRTLVLWAIALIVAIPFAGQQSDRLTGGGFEAPEAESTEVDAVIEDGYPGMARGRLGAVVTTGDGEAPLRRGLVALRTAVGETPYVSLPPRLPATSWSGDRAIVLVPLRVEVNEDHATDVAADLRSNLDRIESSGFAADVYLVGQGAMIAGVQERAQDDLAKAERVGFPVVLLVLLVIFGSIAAALVPFALGILAIAVTGAVIVAITGTMEMSIYVTTLASMVGIGVSVDYSLFLLARYRQELSSGSDPDQARRIAIATSGRSVGFSGLTVIVALAGLFVLDNTALRSMAMGAIVVVAVSVLASLTVVPAVLALGGRRFGRRNRWLSWRPARWRHESRHATPGDPRPFWRRWATLVMDHAVVAVAASSALLLFLALPVLDLDARTGALSQLPKDDPVRQGFELAADQVGPGALSPTKVLVRSETGSAPRLAALAEAARLEIVRDPEVVKATRPRPTEDGGAYLIEVTPRSDPESEQAKEMVGRLRTLSGEDGLSTGAGVEIMVGGVTAAQLDSENLIYGSLWKVLLAVLLLSLAVLAVLLKSLVLPIKSVVMNLLSVGAAYGILVVVFQWGWFDDLLGFESPGYIDTLTLPLVLAVVFGLSMDYEVFLLSRIRESYTRTGSTRAAVVEGLSASAATITSAAFIMVTVFSVFVATSVPSIKEIGLGSATAVALDATVVRLTLVPAAMVLVGRWNWWLPRFLQGRELPRRERPSDVAG